ncbi:MAG: putative ATP-dependent endonuclease of the family [Candidatus Petromonas sp.]|jgi:putative ATP-dependent endonuclease of OLD family|nr:putative ATP-dependent endonuclease of the family [Candidatus Petromonas sp.]
MYINKIIRIENYRNLSGLVFEFNKEINFIVGENNVGKTNLLELLNKIIRIGKFSEQDFYNVKEPIKVVFQVTYDDDELGFFENIFDVDDELSITITATQENVDSRIEYSHAYSQTYINPKTIKMLNFIYYSSLRFPNKELNFSKNVGTGKVLNYIMKRSLENKNLEQLDLLNKNDIDEVIEEVNKKLQKLNGLASEKIKAYLSDDKENIINRLLEIGDVTGRNISELGDGLQYSFNIFLHILEVLVHLKTTKKDEDFKSLLITDENGLRYLPLIIGLDEPEIHQHPYRQRALIKSVKEIIDNENKEFSQIIKELFGVDGFLGQVFIVTHSPSILLDDYEQIVRIFKYKDGVGVACGRTLDFEDDTHKHLKRSFVYFKEAMFAKSVLLVEGDTEFGAVPVLAKKLNYDLDENGVGLVKMDGADAVLKYLELFEAFNINAIAILDRDKENNYSGNEKIIFTYGIDFEEEIFNIFSFKEYLKYLKTIDNYSFLIRILRRKIHDFDVRAFSLNPTEMEISNTVGEEVMTEIRENEIKELRNVKNFINGALLAKYVSKVPQSFENAIEKLVRGNRYE